jgi:GNAT superfamily N-acetyltransferase
MQCDRLRIRDIDPRDEVAVALLRDAAAEIGSLYLGDAAAERPLPRNDPLGPRDAYVVAWIAHEPVGCGALRWFDESTAEVCRIFVRKAYRRLNVARAILNHLRTDAQRLGYTRLILETGDRQAPAMALYDALGFCRVEPFGRHVSDPTSVCYELLLPPDV